jgi:hypothetical protein
LQQPGALGQKHEYYQTVLAKKLKRDGVPVIDLLPELRARTRELLPQRKYLYHIDDTHWNKAGVAVGVDAILKAEPTLRPH